MEGGAILLTLEGHVTGGVGAKEFLCTRIPVGGAVALRGREVDAVLGVCRERFCVAVDKAEDAATAGVPVERRAAHDYAVPEESLMSGRAGEDSIGGGITAIGAGMAKVEDVGCGIDEVDRLRRRSYLLKPRCRGQTSGLTS